MSRPSWWETLLDVLAARRGIVCAVGAGGKKSTLLRLAEAHLAAGTPRIGLTATVMLAPPPASLAPARIVADPEDLRREVPRQAAGHRLLAYALPATKPGRLGGLPPDLVAALHTAGGFAVTLVKADGARMRAIKAPKPGEPVLPPGTATVLPVVSARAIGRPLDDATVHRPERFAMLTGAVPGAAITAAHVARLLASEHGALQAVGDATVVPVINAVDVGNREAARAAARGALAQSRRFDRVVLAAMVASEAVVEVVRRD